MDVVGKDETTQLLGPLRSVWTSSIADSRPTEMGGTDHWTDDRSDGPILGIKILANALAAFGATVSSVDVDFRQAREVQFSYFNVTSTSVSPLEAGDYLTKCRLNTGNQVVRHYFTGAFRSVSKVGSRKSGVPYRRILKSNSITVIATDEHGVEVNLDIPAIQVIVGGNVGVKPSGASSGTVMFSGPEPLTFGFIVDEIEYDGARWSLSGAAASGDKAFGATAAVGATDISTTTATPPILLGSGCSVRM
jgi:hypothetical protein